MGSGPAANDLGQERALLEQIHAHPDDDAPRRVYADHLSERGLGWGEVMLAELDLPSRAHPDFPGRHRQVLKLQRKHRRQWLEPIRPFVASVTFSRGLLSGVVCDAWSFLQAADAISLRAPRGQLTLLGLTRAQVPMLAATPLGRFASVGLDIDAMEIATLMASSTVRGVEAWSFRCPDFTDQAAHAFAYAPSVAGVHTLILYQGRPTSIGGAGLSHLLRAGANFGLTTLVLEVTDIGGALDGPLPALRHLKLRVATDIDGGLLERLGRLRTLQRLNLNTSSVQWRATASESDVRRLVGALPELVELDLPLDLPADLRAQLEQRLRAAGA